MLWAAHACKEGCVCRRQRFSVNIHNMLFMYSDVWVLCCYALNMCQYCLSSHKARVMRPFSVFAVVLFLRSWWLGRRPQERWLQSSAFPKKLSRGRKRASRMKLPFSGSRCHMTKRMFAEERLSTLHQSWVFLFLLSLLMFNSYWPPLCGFR